MGKEELVSAYLEGQVGRRTFIRRLVAAGVSLAAAMTYADVLRADPARAAEGGHYDYYDTEPLIVVVSGATLTPLHLRSSQRRLVQWNITDNETHELRSSPLGSPGGFNSPPRVISDPPFQAVFYAAGLYRYICFNHPGVRGTVHVPLKVRPQRADAGVQRVVTWSWTTLPGLVHDVKIQLPGSDEWTLWRDGTTSRRATLRPGRAGLYQFRARLRDPSNGKTTGWSDAKGMRVL